MRKLCTVLFLLLLCSSSFAQNSPNIGIKWAPTGLLLGSVSLQGEYNFGNNSLTAKIGIPIARQQTFQFDGSNADFTMKATSFLAGYRTYLSKKHMHGFYFEPYFKYVQHSSEGNGNATLAGQKENMNFTNNYSAVGLGVQLGVQFLIRKKFVVDFFFLGPEMNSAQNNFKAIETTSTTTWTASQSSEAEQDIRNFLNQFPFVRNRVNVAVDPNNKIVTANFKGLLPGYRIGVSFGYAF